MAQEITTTSEAQTACLAHDFAAHLAQGDVVALYGPLGAGKSVFARALIRALMGQPDLIVPSPTFTLVQTYEASIGTLWHFDLYRLKNPEEIWELGWEEALHNGIVLIEWPEHAGAFLPTKRWDITVKTTKNDTQRIIKIVQL